MDAYAKFHSDISEARDYTEENLSLPDFTIQQFLKTDEKQREHNFDENNK